MSRAGWVFEPTGTPAPVAGERTCGVEAPPARRFTPADRYQPAAGGEAPRPPERLFATSGGVEVRTSREAGDFYCEHTLFLALRTAAAPCSSVRANRFGEHLVGFLHVPADVWAYQSPSATAGLPPLERHQGTAEVVGAALRGYADEVYAQEPAGPARILLTGFGEFEGITNNPTGEFVGSKEALDAALAFAYGDLLLGPGVEVEHAGEGRCLSYWVADPDTGLPRELQVVAVRLEVSDRAIDGRSPGSIQQLIRQQRPDAVLSLGVSRRTPYYRAEGHADSRNLDLTPTPSHGVAERVVELPENWSLARALAAFVPPEREEPALLASGRGESLAPTAV